MAVTIKDIAKMCGVGVSTVSRAINGHPDVNPDTRDKIMKAVKETGFVPNASARSLKQSESNNIAILVKGYANPFFTRMMHLMERSIQNRDCQMILRYVDNDQDEVQEAIALSTERKLKGIIFLGGDFQHDPQELSRLDVPYIFSTIGKDRRKKDNLPNYANVSVDDYEAAKMAVEYLVGLGHTRIGIIAEGLNIPSVGKLRYEGYLAALKEKNIEFDENLVYEITEGLDHYTMENGYKAAHTLLRKAPDMTALFCIADVVAIGACRALADDGKKIPKDVSVLGFDGITNDKYFIPRLSTVRQPVDRLSSETVGKLFEMIDGTGKPESILLPAELVVAESTARRSNP